jgi:hypothetical protein
MNDDSKIEHLLLAMPLAKPGERLDRRVLSGPRIILGPLAGYIAAAAAAAAIVVAVAMSMTGGAQNRGPAQRQLASVPGQGAAGESANEIRVEQDWSQLSYQGLLTTDSGVVFRKFVQEDVKCVTLVDESSGRDVQVTVPTQQAILVKAEMY